MAQNRYFTGDKSSLFSIENDIDDDEFLRKRPNNGSSYPYSVKPNALSYDGNPFATEHEKFEERRMQLLEKKREIEERTIESSKRSLSLLRNSEEVGIATAEELMKQREQLERTDKRLDDINQTLRFSHKHIQGIKSVFGSLKNYLSGKVDSAPPGPSESFTKDSSCKSNEENTFLSPHTQTFMESVSVTLPSNSVQLNHPGLRIRGLDEEDDSVTSCKVARANPQKVLDENLDEIMNSITRLKGLANNLGTEMESQNDLLDNILPKVEKSDITIQRQNKDIKRLLK